MRGRPIDVTLNDGTNRNTPAYAGKTMTAFFVSDGRQKHPRVCGEDPDRTDRKDLAKETPPRMRGRLADGDYSESDSGNTPAYAGKTLPPGSADS